MGIWMDGMDGYAQRNLGTGWKAGPGTCLGGVTVLPPMVPCRSRTLKGMDRRHRKCRRRTKVMARPWTRRPIASSLRQKQMSVAGSWPVICGRLVEMAGAYFSTMSIYGYVRAEVRIASLR